MQLEPKMPFLLKCSTDRAELKRNRLLLIPNRMTTPCRVQMRQALAKILPRCNKYRSALFSKLLKVNPEFGQTIITSYHSYQVVMISRLLWLQPHSIIQDTFLPQEITEG
jgi:hypothetical protein